MQAILYRDTPYVILWYNVNLQAFRTDTWTGYGAVPAKDGAPFFNLTRATYQDLKPRAAGAVAAPSGGSPWVYVLVAAAVLATVVRRRPRASPAAGRSRTHESGCRPTQLLDIWPDEAIEAMHLASLALLERAGVKVESPAARELFLAAGCTLSAADRVLVPRAVVADAVAACPASYTLAARDPEKSLVLDAEPGVTYVHNMGGARDVIDPRSGAGRRARLSDQVRASRVMHSLVNQSQVTSLVAARRRARPARAAVFVPCARARDRQGHRRSRDLAPVPGAVPAGDGRGRHRRGRLQRRLSRWISPSRR